MHTYILKTAGAMLLACASHAALAADSLEGLWQTDGAMVRITGNGGVYSGRIERLLKPSAAAPKCEKCTDERKDQPLDGMTILRNLRQEGGERSWAGGDILEPASGKVYNARLKLSPDGRQLEMRAYLGAPALGRSQTWTRAE